ncbi:hypothetical protein BKA66DRAFT_161536 [Pyrenochaeta sp. MPI-SDFR-AT-0127]|nr:hypothetical protein BKA66DRAFT_161536 [Pyrenochaeta sp. MPI-SDFR-AT-0127]
MAWTRRFQRPVPALLCGQWLLRVCTFCFLVRGKLAFRPFVAPCPACPACPAPSVRQGHAAFVSAHDESHRPSPTATAAKCRRLGSHRTPNMRSVQPYLPLTPLTAPARLQWRPPHARPHHPLADKLLREELETFDALRPRLSNSPLWRIDHVFLLQCREC